MKNCTIEDLQLNIMDGNGIRHRVKITCINELGVLKDYFLNSHNDFLEFGIMGIIIAEECQKDPVNSINGSFISISFSFDKIGQNLEISQPFHLHLYNEKDKMSSRINSRWERYREKKLIIKRLIKF